MNIAVVSLLVLLTVLYLVFWLKALFEAVRGDLDPATKGLWVVAILVFQVVGPLAWYLVGPRGRRATAHAA